MFKQLAILFFLFFFKQSLAQLLVARDSITVIENNYVLKMPWAGGINYSNVSNMDLNFDGKKDLVVYDRINDSGVGRFRCFINNGNAGEIKYRAVPELSSYFPQAISWAVLLDYDCDNKEDIFCYTSLGIKVYKNFSSQSNGISFQVVDTLLNSDYNPGGTPFYANIYASSVGVPGIADIDGDGDLDILTFSPQGSLIEYHQNLSKEKNYNCDSLIFQYSDNCWGKISEGGCSVDLNSSFCNPQKPIRDFPQSINNKEYHAGSCLTCIDSDGDGDKDLILGDIYCNVVQYVHNGGTPAQAFFVDTTKLYPNYPLKNNTTQIKLNNFPCTYYVDVDADGKKDLIASPNAATSENFKSLWYYKNASLTNTVNFQFVKNNFLQDEMIEVGQNSYPLVFDYNADGKPDLLIGNYGYYLNGLANPLSARLTLYKNIGTGAQPSYSLITRDYAGLSAYPAIFYAMPTVGDIDNDGDMDICFGTSTGQIHWLENTAGANATCNFSIFHNNPFAFTTGSSVAAPQLFDIDNDGKLDLLIGTRNGRISFYKNTGIVASSPTFSLISNFFGNVDVKGNTNIFGIDGYAAPYFYRENNTVKLLVGSVNGNVFYYDVPSNIYTAFNLVSNFVNFFNEGLQSTVCFEDVNADGKRDLFIGNGSGGLSFFSSNSPFVGINEPKRIDLVSQISVFPNPANSVVTIRINGIEFQSAIVQIKNVVGETVYEKTLHANTEDLQLHELPPGIYFTKILIQTNQQQFTVTKKILKE